MSTRSSARNLFPPLDNLELTIQRRSRVGPTLLNDFEMAVEGPGDLPVPDLRTMEELYQPSLNGRGVPIAPIAIQAMNFGLKNDMIQQVQNSCQFHGLPGDDANKHLDKFLHVTQSIKVNGVIDDALRLYLFPHSLTHHATAWFDRLPRNSINTFEQMAKMFLGKYFPPSMVTKLRNEITNFRQHPDESLFEAWERYKLSIDRWGTFMKRRLEECYDLIENITAYHNDWDTSAQRSESSSSSTSSFDTKIAALKAEMAKINKNLMRVLQPPLATLRTYMLREPIKFMKMNTASSLGSRTLPSNTINNLEEELKGIITRSGTAYQGPMIPTTPSSLPPVIKRETEATKDTVHPTNKGSTKDVQPLVVPTKFPILNSEPVVAPIIEPVVAHVSAPKPNQNPLIPYPSRLHDQRLRDKANDQREKFFQILKDLNFNISFADALILMPKFGPTIKTLLTNKDKLFELARTPLNEHCSAVLLKKLPEKLGDPGNVKQTLSSLSVSYVYDSKARRSLDFSSDFDADPRVPLILGRSFLKTERALINVFKGELTLRVGKEAITFNLDQTSRYSANYNDMTANQIDVIDMACEEYSQEVLNFSDVIASGNPTPYYDPIVSTTSSTLTPFENSDFLLEEVDAFLALEDDPTSPKVDQSYVDTEGDILLLEAFLNDDPSLPPPNQGNYMPQVQKELKICEANFDKSSINEPPEVELKDLPPHLEYAFLEGDDKFPIIIAKDLSVEEKIALRSRKNTKCVNAVNEELTAAKHKLMINLFLPLDNPEHTIRRRSHTDPTLLNDFEMAAEGNGDLPVPNLHTMKTLCQPSLNGRGATIGNTQNVYAEEAYEEDYLQRFLQMTIPVLLVIKANNTEPLTKAVNTACYVQNSVLVTKPHNKTPYELLHGRLLSIGFMRPFGCPVTILNTLDPLGKFQGKVDERFLVGYSVCSKAFRVFNSRTRVVQETLHVNFKENKSNVAGSGPAWLFDIDSLTQTMNYHLVIAENQTNSHADALVDGKEHDDDIQKSVSPDIHSSSSGAQTRKQGDKTENIDKGTSLVVTITGFRDLNADIEECTNNNSNGVNAASSSIFTVGHNFINSTNEFSAVGPLNVAMPNLENLSHSDDADAVGAEADINNLECIILDERGIVIRNKAKLVAQGHTQEKGIDYKEVFTPVARIEAIRLFLAYASFMGFPVYQINIKSAFLYGTIEEEVYVYQPPGFEDLENPDKVYKVVKALYGLHQAPRAWSMIGSLLYLTSSRPDIKFAVYAYARFQVTLKVSHLNAVKRIFRYLKGKPYLGLWYLKDLPFDLVAYSDSDYAVARLDIKSTTRGCDVTRLQALVDKKKIVISEVVIHGILQLDDAEGIVCLPNEEIFAGLDQIGYEKPSTKLTFYKAFFYSQSNTAMASAVICLSKGQRFNFSKYIFDSLVRNVDSSSKFYMYPRFIQLIIQNQVGDLSTHTTRFISLALTQKVFANMRRVGKGFSGVEIPLFEGMLGVRQPAEEGLVDEQVQVNDVVATAVEENVAEDVAHDVIPSPPSHAIPSPSQEPSSPPQQPQSSPQAPPQDKLVIIKLKARVKRLEKANLVKSSKLRHLRKVGASRRIEPSDDIEDVFNQGRMIDDMDKDEGIELVKDADIAESEGRHATEQADNQAEIYHIDLDHSSKVLSMQEDDSEVQEVVEVMTTTKLITEVDTTAASQVSAASATIPAAALTVVVAYTRRRKGYIKRYQGMKKRPQTESEARKNMMIYLKNIAGYKIDFFKGMTYAQICPIFQARFDENMRFLFKSSEEIEEEDQEIIKSINETPSQKTAKRRKLSEEAQEAKDLRKSFTTLLKNFDREDLENL
nr:reverse transcriptase domain-containing protein [Tanacetum cinerariifolium]